MIQIRCKLVGIQSHSSVDKWNQNLPFTVFAAPAHRTADRRVEPTIGLEVVRR